MTPGTRAGSDSPRPRRLLAVASFPPFPVVDGLTLRVCALLRELAADWQISLVAPPGKESGSQSFDSAEAAPSVARFTRVQLEGGHTYWPYQYDPGPLVKAVGREIRAWRPDVALVWVGSEFLALRDEAFPPVVADRVDCVTLKTWRELPDADGFRDLLSRLNTLRIEAGWERRVAGITHATVVVGEDDARWLRRLTGARNVHVIPNGVQVPPSSDLASEAPEPTVAFTGVMNYAPNVDAAQHFARNVWPLVRSAVPDAKFVVAGRQPAPEVLALRAIEGVEVTGEVPDMGQVLARAWVAVAPMRRGSGVKNKILEAWAAGTPVVMTSLANNGLPEAPVFRDCVVDGPRPIAKAVVRLLRSPTERKRLGEAAHRLAGDQSWGRVAARFSTLLEGAAEGRRQR